MAGKRWAPSRRTPRYTLQRVRTYAACCAQCRARAGCRRFDVGWQGCTLYFTANIGTARARGYLAGRGEPAAGLRMLVEGAVWLGCGRMWLDGPPAAGTCFTEPRLPGPNTAAQSERSQ